MDPTRRDGALQAASGPGPDSADHPNLPRRGPVLGALGAVVLAGAVGAAVGWGIVDVGTTDGSTLVRSVGAVVGASVAAAGAGVVAVLMLRAMAEWRSHGPPAATTAGRTDRRVAPSVVVVGTILAAVTAMLVVGAILTVRDAQQPTECGLLSLGPAEEWQARLATTGPFFLHGGGDCGFWADLDDGEIVAYDVRADDPSGDGECVVQHDLARGYTCDGRPISARDLDRLPVDTAIADADGSGPPVVRVDLRPPGTVVP